MTRIGGSNLTVLSLISVSLIGLVLALMLLLYTPTSQDFPWRRPIVGSTYASICVLGAIAVFFPKKCSQTLNPKSWRTALTTTDGALQPEERETTNLFGLKLTHGHHPNCESFRDHEFQIGNKTFCAGCTGLLIGALISLMTVSAYFLSPVRLDEVAIPLIGLGFIAVLAGLLTPFFITGRSTTRLAMNALLILGMSSILVGADALLHSIEIDLYLISLDVLWLTTRISLSRVSHEGICTYCMRKCIP